MPTRISDQPCLLQSMGLDRNGISPHPEHMRKKFLRQGEGGTYPEIAKASGKADFVQNGARGRQHSAAPASGVSTDSGRPSSANAEGAPSE